MPPPIKALALDYGEARIGVARSDVLGLMAHPVETVAAQPRAAALGRIAQLFAEAQASLLVIGLPIREDGTEGTAAAKIRQFAQALISKLPAGTTVHFQDEYRTTEQAKQHLSRAGKKARNHRPIIDQVAAVVILQEYLDQQSGGFQIEEK